MRLQTAAYPHTIKWGTEFANENHTGNLDCITPRKPVTPLLAFSLGKNSCERWSWGISTYAAFDTQRWDALHLAVEKGLMKTGNSYLKFLSQSNDKSSIYWHACCISKAHWIFDIMVKSDNLLHLQVASIFKSSSHTLSCLFSNRKLLWGLFPCYFHLGSKDTDSQCWRS